MVASGLRAGTPPRRAAHARLAPITRAVVRHGRMARPNRAHDDRHRGRMRHQREVGSLAMTTVTLIDGRQVDTASEYWRRRDAERLLSRVSMIPIAGCWIWTGAIAQGGYASVWLRGRVVGAHKAAYLTWIGDIPAGKNVCHRCDVRCCINPYHLFLGDQFENMRDAALKGRIGHHCAKLTFEQAQEIRSSQGRGVDIARQYGVSQNILCNLRAGRSYRRHHALRKAA